MKPRQPSPCGSQVPIPALHRPATGGVGVDKTTPTDVCGLSYLESGEAVAFPARLPLHHRS